jgi:hypothetical protein
MVSSDRTFVPNLIILGTPKSGTSSLHEWLSAHPEIGEGSEKEVRFLLDPEEPLSRPDGFAKTGLAGYEAYFPARREHPRRYWIDSSPTYYYQRTAIDVISALERPPILGLLYRQPGPRIYSYYQYAIQNQAAIPRNMTFEQFLKAAEEGPDGPLRATPGLSGVLEHSDYAKYTEMWLSRLPRERFFFLRFEDVVSKQREVMNTLCDKLELKSDFYDSYDFPQENRSYFVKNPRLHGVSYSVARRLALPASVRRGLRRIYEALNTKELDRERDDRTEQLIADLDVRFTPTVARLEDLTGLDLSAWRR